MWCDSQGPLCGGQRFQSNSHLGSIRGLTSLCVEPDAKPESLAQLGADGVGFSHLWNHCKTKRNN
jgi:hypothetical protein